MKKVLFIFASIMLIGSYSCKNYLDQVPEDDIETIESIFETRRGASVFYNTCMSVFSASHRPHWLEGNPVLHCGGETTSGEWIRALYPSLLGILDGYQNSTSPYYNLWTMARNGVEEAGSMYACIRFCNIFIENIDNVNDMEQEEKDRWKAEIKCYKAYYYFELMKMYGPITLVPHNIPVDADIAAMQLPRSPIDECVEAIVNLFDEAIPYLQKRQRKNASDKVSFSVEGAYGYKARVLLYAASPLFNGNEWYTNFLNRDGIRLFPEYDKEKWKRAAEAADKAIEVMQQSGIDLRKESAQKSTKLQNTIFTLQKACVFEDSWTTLEDEWLFALAPGSNGSNYRRLTSPRWRSGHSLYNSDLRGVVGTNIATVENFYTANGLPINKDRTWPYNNRYKMGKETDQAYSGVVNMEKDVINLHLRREPRFYAAIAGDGLYWTFNETPRQIEPYRGAPTGTESSRFDDPSVLQNISGYWIKKFWLPTDGNTSYSPILMAIMRATELYLIQAEAWNEYSGPSEKVYNALDVVRNRAGLPPVRQAWSAYSTNPEEVNTQDGLRMIIQQERMNEFVFEGHQFWDLRRWKRAHDVLNKSHEGWNVLGRTAAEFYNNYEGPKIVSTKPKFVAPRDYFWPIKAEERIVSNIVQNPNW